MVIPVININLLACNTFVFYDLLVMCLGWTILSPGKKSTTPKSDEIIQKKLNCWSWEFSKHIGCFHQRIQQLLGFCSYLATLIPLVTNAGICVALYPSNAQKRNAFLSVGKLASNAYIGI
jgi:hypothetical protein